MFRVDTSQVCSALSNAVVVSLKFYASMVPMMSAVASCPAFKEDLARVDVLRD